MSKLRPRPLQVKNHFNKKNCSLREIEEGMLLSFNYYGDTINDYFPFIYVVEKRLDRIYGLNLRYSPYDLQKIITLKDKELKKELENQLSLLKKQNENINIDESKALQLIKTKIPSDYLLYFIHDVSPKIQSKILRNYIPSKMKAITKFIFKVQ